MFFKFQGSYVFILFTKTQMKWNVSTFCGLTVGMFFKNISRKTNQSSIENNNLSIEKTIKYLLNLIQYLQKSFHFQAQSHFMTQAHKIISLNILRFQFFIQHFDIIHNPVPLSSSIFQPTHAYIHMHIFSQEISVQFFTKPFCDWCFTNTEKLHKINCFQMKMNQKTLSGTRKCFAVLFCFLYTFKPLKFNYTIFPIL